MKDEREEIGTGACLVGIRVKSQMRLAGHVARVKDERLMKRSVTKKQGDSRKRGRPQLGWEDFLKGETRMAEEDNWRKRPEREREREGEREKEGGREREGGRN